MDKNEFIQKQKLVKSYQRRTAFFILGCVLFVFITGFVVDSNKQAGDASSGVVSILVAGTLLVTLLTLSVFGRKLRVLGLNCPNCTKPLVGSMGRVAIATDKCGRCGHTLFVNVTQSPANPSDGAPSIPPLPTARSLQPQELARLNQQLQLNNRVKGGSSWFLWIAGMSLINTIMQATGSSFRFVTGLGLTTFVDAVAIQLSRHESVVAHLVKLFSMVFDAVAIGTFIFLWLKARQRRQWAFLTGLMLYGIDTPVLFLFKDWLGVGFHVLALFFIYNGWKALKELDQLEASMVNV